MDIKLPYMNGLQATEFYKIIFLTRLYKICYL
ncbi:unknown [Roseburia sp. CAG:303]|nr:unknown [Roseburia sp. CAG:303]